MKSTCMEVHVVCPLPDFESFMHVHVGVHEGGGICNALKSFCETYHGWYSIRVHHILI
jgi:hypothetical protein